MDSVVLNKKYIEDPPFKKDNVVDDEYANIEINNLEGKKNIEERYTKLRGFAIKLKKKVCDLIEEKKSLEDINGKLKNDNQDLYHKVSLMSESVKKLQTIQSQNDQLVDDVEKLKKENKILILKLKNLGFENNVLKDTNVKMKNQISELTVELTNFSRDNCKLEDAHEKLKKKIKDLNNELRAESVINQQKTKECNELKNLLEAEIKAHKSVCLKLVKIQHDYTSSNVLTLEVANYEKSINALKAKLEEELNERINIEIIIIQHLQTIKTLTKKVAEFQSSSISNTNCNTFLMEKNFTMESEFKDAELEFSKTVIYKKDKCLISLKKNLEAQVKLLVSEIYKLQNAYILQLKTSQVYIDELKRETWQLNLSLKNSKQEINTLQEEFENYKFRAQSVLSKAKILPCNELEEEIEHGKRQVSLLTDKCLSYEVKIDTLVKEIVLLKDERSRTVASEEELITKLKTLKKDSIILLEKCKNQELEIQLLQVRQVEILKDVQKNCEEQMSQLKKKYEDEIQFLKLKLGSNYDSIFHVDTLNNVCVEEISATRPLVEREECEGSESVESLQASIQISEQNKKTKQCAPEIPVTAITPLDKLLEFSFDVPEVDLNVIEDRSKLDVYKNRVKYLSELLSDAERDIEKLTQLNHLLKEDIRRQKRFVEREKEAVNLEYLKNIVFKFLTLENNDERSQLIPVLDTILKLSPEETLKLNEIVSATKGVIIKRKWIPSWSAAS